MAKWSLISFAAIYLALFAICTGTSTVAKPAASTTPTSLSLPDSQTDGKKWVKSPSSPVFPVASQGSTTTPRGLSTPTHVTSSQVGLVKYR